MFLFYAAFGLVWGWFCYRHLQELLPIQVRQSILLVGGFDLKLCSKYYLSGLVGLLVIEMFASWGALRLFIMQEKY
jgi:hypothetical protein